jgi:hypothetical protein
MKFDTVVPTVEFPFLQKKHSLQGILFVSNPIMNLVAALQELVALTQECCPRDLATMRTRFLHKSP